MTTAFLFTVLGLGQGAAYAIMGLGIVLIQRGSGAINFAQGAIGMMAAFVFADLVRDMLPQPIALLIVLVGAAILGVLWHLVIMRPLRSAPVLAKIVCTLALLAVLQAAAQLRFGAGVQNAAPFFPAGFIEVSGVRLGVDRLFVFATTIIIAIALWAWYRYTLFGVATRAAAESERGASLLGYSPDRIACVNWAIGMMLGAFAGVLVAPIVGLAIPNLTLLILPALAAALLGGFHSFAITAVAGIVIGVSQSLIGHYWPVAGLVEAVPLVAIIAAMMLTGRRVPERGTLGLARQPLAPRNSLRWPTAIVFGGLAVAGLFFFDYMFRSALTTSILSVGAALSVLVIIGFVGQTSLMPLTFAGIGGLLTSKLAMDWGLPFPLPILVAVICTLPIAAALGLPALRVRGLNLAVVTMGAAVTVTALVFNNANLTGGVQGSIVPSPDLFGFSLDPTLYPIRFGLMALGVIGLLIWAVKNLRKSASGLRMLAVRSNERAATMNGVNTAATKLIGFALSGALAAVAGSLFAYQVGAVSFDRFNVFGSIALITAVYIMGISTITGAVMAGLIAQGGLVFLLLQNLIPGVGGYYDLVGGLLLILTVIAQPDGAVVAVTAQVRALRDKLTKRPAESPPATPGSATPQPNSVGGTTSPPRNAVVETY